VTTRNGMTLTVLGSAGSYAAPGNACSGHLVRSPGATVVYDLGNGALANLQRHVGLDEVDAVVLTHDHPDHWLDLPILRNALRYYLYREGLAVYGTAGILEQAEAVISELEPTLLWTTISAETSDLALGDQRLSFSLTDHPVETLAVRIEAAGRTLAYTADTGSAWASAGLLDGADLLLCEATIPQQYEDISPHLTGRQAGALARDAGVRRLVLTHIAPGVSAEEQVAAAAAVFDGPVEVAEVNATLSV
jgi:ribonuclease BN (tRNA processing enzyme)